MRWPIRRCGKKNVPKEMQFSFPLFTMTPSRVVQFMNFADPREFLDESDVLDFKEDFQTECERFGEVLAIEIPRPDLEMQVVPMSVGKIFVKFSHIIAAK